MGEETIYLRWPAAAAAAMQERSLLSVATASPRLSKGWGW